ncbi:MAG: hypothetical protein L0220_06635 [Acidobacteria bacterium]|nr:hypothetical protein [Acidobacteriota bacterium]
MPNKKFHTPWATQTSANNIALQLRSEPASPIIWLMTWDELQDLQLEVAREVGAARSLRVQLAEPEDLHDAAFEFNPMMMRRWGLFRRRPRLREIAVAFYQPDDQTQPYFIFGNWLDLNELDKLDPSAYRRDLAVAIRNGLEQAENMRRSR